MSRGTDLIARESLCSGWVTGSRRENMVWASIGVCGDGCYDLVVSLGELK